MQFPLSNTSYEMLTISLVLKVGALHYISWNCSFVIIYNVVRFFFYTNPLFNVILMVWLASLCSSRFIRWTSTMLPSNIACPSRRQHPATRSCQWSEASFSTCSPSASSSVGTWPCTASAMASRRSSLTSRERRSMKSSLWSGPCWSSAGIMWAWNWLLYLISKHH